MSGRPSPYASSSSSGRVRGLEAQRAQPVSRAAEPKEPPRNLGAVRDAAGARSSTVPHGGQDRKWLEGLPESQLEHLYHALRATGTAGGDVVPPVREASPPPLRDQYAIGEGAQWSITPFAGDAMTPPRSGASMRASDLTGIASPALPPNVYPPKEGIRAVSSSARPSPAPGRFPGENGAVHHAPPTAAEPSERLIAERRQAVTDLLGRAGAAQQRVAAHLRSRPPPSYMHLCCT